MNPDRWQKIEAVFQAAVDLKAEDRENFLKNQCRDDFELKSEVEKLLSNFDSAESFIEKPVWTDSYFVDSEAKKHISDSFDEIIEDEREESLVGKTIGVYRLVKELGRGGMGAVYLGERADGEFQQKVAVKLIKRGMDSDFIVKRFRYERQILASFEHQFIARLLDGGTTENRLPYFVMEFVEGDSLYDFCDKNRFALRKRLEIFRQICSAISYAHARQIIHRDIKPSNILFTKSGVPKLLDFGIAKILNTDLIHESVNPTASIIRLMTPDYASPEQVCGSKITIVSDIYSLGVLLYELLTGHRPYNFAGKSLHEVSRTVCEVVPEMPSKIIGKDENLLSKYFENSETVAEVRSTSLENLKKEIEGNLDKIVMKALAKEPSERYASVREFSEDIGRFLAGEKVKAEFYVPKKNIGADEQFQKTTGKSLAVLPFKTLNLTAAGDTGDKFLGMGLADALITRLSRIRHLIVRPTSSILGFEEENFDILKAADELKVDYILDGNIKRAGTRLRVTVQLLDVARNATIWATSIDETVGDFFSLEDTISNKVVEALLPQITGSDLEEFSKRGTDNAEAFEHYLRGRYYFNTSTEEGFAKAFVSFHSAISEDPEYAHAYAGLADYYTWLGIFGVLPPQECFQPAIEMAKKAVELDDKLPEAHATLGFVIHAGNYDWSKGEYHLGRSLELNPNYATALAWFGIVRFTEGRFDEGLVFARRAISLDPLTPFNHHNLGWGLYFARRFDESIAQYRRVTKEFPNYGLGFYGLSKVLRITGNTKEAIKELENAKRIFGESNFLKLAEAENLAADGHNEKALDILRELEKFEDERFVSPYQKALAYSYLGDEDKAFAALEKASEKKDAWLNWLGVEPVLDILRADERFQKLLEFTGYEVFFGTSSIGNRSFLEKDETSFIQNLPTLSLEKDEKPIHRTADTLPLKTKSFRQKPWIYIAAGVFILLIAGGGIWQYEIFRGKSGNEAVITANSHSIAILPFKTEDSTDENLSIGLADALSNRLGYIRRLSVIAPNSARSVADRETEEIGKNLNVGYILRGNLKEQENSIEVTAELVNTKNEAIIWTENFTSSDGSLFEIQTKIAEKIWKAMGIEPLPNERQLVSKSFTRNSAAYDLYLIGRYQLINRSPDNIRKAINTFTQAIGEDPNFALAYAGLADAYALQKVYQMPPPEDAFAKAKENALKAIELDENLVQAHTSLAYIRFYGERNREGAELEFRRAIQLNPSYSQAHHWFGLLLISMKRPADAVAEIETAAQLDPNSSIVKTALAMAYLYDKKYDEAIKTSKEVLALNNDFVPAYRVLRASYLMKKDYNAARTAFQKEINYSGGETNDPGWYMIVAQVESLKENKREIVEKLDEAVKQPVIKNALSTFSYEVALAYISLGEKEKALEWLEKAETSGDNGFVLLEADPRFEDLQNEPRFKALIGKLKNKPPGR